EMDWVDVKGDGELLTFTKLYFGPMGFENFTPYTLGIVDLEGGGRLLGMMEGLDDESIKLGMKVKIVPKVENERVVFSIVKG
ncbi:MAG: OB-fold domain-containing protein, partial [Thermoplasmata archaeon]|nr:OB-fold domain-containing protein [Thermoplasmata archaeon]